MSLHKLVFISSSNNCSHQDSIEVKKVKLTNTPFKSLDDSVAWDQIEWDLIYDTARWVGMYLFYNVSEDENNSTNLVGQKRKQVVLVDLLYGMWFQDYENLKTTTVCFVMWIFDKIYVYSIAES